MKIKSIEIEGVARIKNKLSLNFNEGINIICGINGTCKTTILECITHFFSNGSSTRLRKNANVNIGRVHLVTDKAGIGTYFCDVRKFSPTEPDSFHSSNPEKDKLLYFKINRNYNYAKLDAIPSDIVKTDYDCGSLNANGIQFGDFKGWFVHRYLYSHIANSLTDTQILNFEVAKKCFNMLDNSVSFSRVKADSNDVMVNSQQGEIYFEYLSAGYKSCLYILLGIIKEIEFRFKTPMVAVKDFDGSILIDEVDLHLHPIWQTTIVNSLRQTFPNAQIIVTTHSPHVIQSASPNEVIPLIVNEDGDITVNRVVTNKYGYQGWTIEEILEDVMGMKNTRSELYSKTIEAFTKALDKEDDQAAVANYKILQNMLHPRSHLRKVLEIQIAGIDG